MPRLRYHRGTLLWDGEEPPPGFEWDERVRAWRALALAYRGAVEWLRARGLPYRDEARAWPLDFRLRHLAPRDPRPYQARALQAWRAAGGRGVVVLPTGAGKSYLAEMVMAAVQRPALVVVPTLDLLAQWAHRLSTAFDARVGTLGGGSHELGPLTVSTYASARIHAERLGDRFGLVVFDEVHHLPAEQDRQVAESLLAPYRLGLTATPERDDGGHLLLEELVGPTVLRVDVQELAGDWLAPYETVTLRVRLSEAEQAAYREARERYRRFVAEKRIPVSQPGGWQRFLQEASRSRAGRAAFKGWLEARRIAHGTERKLDLLEQLLEEERGRPTLVFTHDNATAYRISREFLVPCITHQTPTRERRAILQGLADGTYPVVVTSRVLNEGVDLPGAEVAIVVSGTGSVREHVQRLGRILRPGHGKRAVLYELVADGTAEEYTSARRREHEAYDR